MFDLRTNEPVFCWSGVAEAEWKWRDERGLQVWVTSPVGLDGVNPETSELCLCETEFRRHWYEAVLAFDPEFSARVGYLLSREPWCWRDEQTIIKILTELSKLDLDKIVAHFPWKANSFADIQSPPVRGWSAWDKWRKAQTLDVQAALADLVECLVAESRYPADLTWDGL